MFRGGIFTSEYNSVRLKTGQNWGNFARKIVPRSVSFAFIITSFCLLF